MRMTALDRLELEMELYLLERGILTLDDGRWVTINGSHVKIDENGNIIIGPVKLKRKFGNNNSKSLMRYPKNGNIRVSYSGENVPCLSFKNQQYRREHFRRHGHEFNGYSVADYVSAGIAFLAQPCGGDVWGYSYFDDSEGKYKVVRFNSRTTEYATGYPGERICTYFKAKYDGRNGMIRQDSAIDYYYNARRRDTGR